MKVYPKNTGALCAKMDRGLSGQDGFNDMIPVIERNTNGMDNINSRLLYGPGERCNFNAYGQGLQRSAACHRGGVQTWITIGSMSFAA